MILKDDGEEAAERPISFRGFWVLKTDKSVSSSQGSRGKVGNLILVFHFPIRALPGCGNVGISRLWRDSQGAGGRGEKLLLLFHAFHGPGISIALPVQASDPSPSVQRLALAAPQECPPGGRHLARPFGVAHRLRHRVQARKAHALL